ncbi:MAG: hypothetical protein PHS82_00295 [Lachnospiraceae bacterium]|nr:hypothetical protein [Lachnospiraceae bacterium]
MNKKRLLSILLTIAMTLSMTLPTYATTQDKITDAQAEKNAAQSDLADAQNKISGLETKKSELETYLEQLNTQLNELNNDLTSIQTQLDDKELELEHMEASLERAREQETQQYNDMKLRIQYMYENGNATMLELLLEANSISEFLSRAETISQLSTYDRNKLDTYKATKEEIQDKEAALQDEQNQLATLKADREAKQAEVSALAETTDSKIAEYTSTISQEELNASSLQEKIANQQKLLTELAAKATEEKAAAEKKAAEEAAAAKVAAQKQAEEAAAEAAQDSKDQGSKDQASSSSSSSSSSGTDSAPAKEEVSDNSTSTGQGQYLGKFKLTAYCACSKCCGSYANGITASGTTATAGRTVAMAGVPFGTKLMINGNIYTVEDRGTSYGHVDIFHNSHSEALSFGLQYADVYQLS